MASSEASPYEAANPFGSAGGVPARIDAAVAGKLREAGLSQSPRCSDGVFLRRVFLDIIGTLPTAGEAGKFLADPSPAKRRVLIDALLARPEYAEFWGMRWADILRVKSEFPVKLWPQAAQAYDRFLRQSLRENRPYSRLACELLTATGSNFRDPAVNFLRSAGGQEPASLSAAACLTFLGERTANWPEAKQGEVARFFSRVGFKKTKEWKEEIVFVKPGTGGESERMVLPDGTTVDVPAGGDPRQVFADWLINSPRSNFAANGANRLWFWMMGTGIVQEPDDFRTDNPPSNPALLNVLAGEFARSGYDAKHMIRIIANSATYQASCLPRGEDAGKAAAYFASYPVRRLEAEVLADAINRVTGATDEYMSMVPEPFTWIPPNTRAISLPDGGITSTFLELFGRPARDTGLLGERNMRVTTAQRLHMLNSRQILDKLKKSEPLNALISSPQSPRLVAGDLYLTILSRHPTADELKTIEEYVAGSGLKPREAYQDILWALINTPEFQTRH